MVDQAAFFPDSTEVLGGTAPTRSRRKSAAVVKSKIYDCGTCGLRSACRHPQIQKFGEGALKILFVGMCPGYDEDRIGVPFVGRSGDLLKRHCGMTGIDLDKDCFRTNIVACYKNSDPTKEQILACRPNLLRDIQEVQPKLIICLGDEAINAVLEKPKGCHSFSRFAASFMHGRVVPSHKFNCWVASSYYPAFYLHRKTRDDVPNDENLLVFDIAKALSYLDKPLPQPLTEDGNYLVDDVEKAVSLLEQLSKSIDPVSYDYETTTLRPWDKGAQIVSLSLSPNVEEGYFLPLDLVNPATGRKFFSPGELETIYGALRSFLKSDAPKIVQNINMEEIWNREVVGQGMNNFVHDTMLGAHVLKCNTLTTSLAFQVFELTGHDYKGMVDVHHISKAPLEKVLHYNCWDSRYLHPIYQHQISGMLGEGRLLEFNTFMQRGSFALVNLYQRGVPIDLKVLSELEKQFLEEQVKCGQEIRLCKGVQKYEEQKKSEFNSKSDAQIGKMLYQIYQIPVKKKTAGKKGSTDIDVLQEVLRVTTDPDVKNFVNCLVRLKQCKKFLERVANYRRLVDKNSRVHPCYNMHIADTYRSSANDPSIQNVFKHDEELKVFRKCIVPSPGNIILEVDRAGIEVCQMAMSTGDQELTKQIIDGVDTHRRWSSEIYGKPEKLITKDERYETKQNFIFASFYGAVPSTIARKFPTIPASHIAHIQEKFWKEFHGVKEWQNRTIQEYCNTGYVEGVSGFRRYGPLNINKLYNTPIQGPAFHLTLMDIIQIELENVLIKRGFKSVVLFEIHDSLTIDTVIEEAEELVAAVTEIMTDRRFDWQRNVPLKVEWEVSRKNWFGLAELVFRVCPKCNRRGPQGKKILKKETGKVAQFECMFCGQIEEVEEK